MKENLYRGKIKGKATGHYELDWAFGNRVDELSTGRVFICDLSHFDDKTLLKDVIIEVEPATVGQFTGDREFSVGSNGKEGIWKEIFDGDIIRIESSEDGNGEFLVSWNEERGSWWLNNLRGTRGTDCADAIRKIGNKWDNPKLLKERDKP